MIGYWLYKYEIEDRDIGVVDYISLVDATDIDFPRLTLCIKSIEQCSSRAQHRILDMVSLVSGALARCLAVPPYLHRSSNTLTSVH